MTPRAAAEWLAGLPGRLAGIPLRDLLLWLALAAAVALAVRLLRRWVDREIDDVNRRHKVRKAVGYAGVALVVLAGAAMLAGRATSLAAVLGILAAGAAVALQDTAKNAVGWLYLSSRSGLSPGARVEVDGVVGEVIDVGVMKTTILEVGHLVEGRQSSGRLASIPNAKFMSQAALYSPDYSPWAWHETSFLLTYESDWERGIALLEELGAELHDELEPEMLEGFRRLERSFAFKHGPLTPIVYVQALDSGVQLTLRFLTHIRRRRGSEDRLVRAVLREVERDPGLEIAYPTWRVYRRDEERGEGPAEPAR
jgi:small-conductance mechanosensitive channel